MCVAQGVVTPIGAVVTAATGVKIFWPSFWLLDRLTAPQTWPWPFDRTQINVLTPWPCTVDRYWAASSSKRGYGCHKRPRVFLDSKETYASHQWWRSRSCFVLFRQTWRESSSITHGGTFAPLMRVTFRREYNENNAIVILTYDTKDLGHLERSVAAAIDLYPLGGKSRH